MRRELSQGWLPERGTREQRARSSQLPPAHPERPGCSRTIPASPARAGALNHQTQRAAQNSAEIPEGDGFKPESTAVPKGDWERMELVPSACPAPAGAGPGGRWGAEDERGLPSGERNRPQSEACHLGSSLGALGLVSENLISCCTKCEMTKGCH